ncbi:peptide deformylase [Streptomyces sp. Agncl-13]|uniref:peptide deformylase n=1 Tax=Streptomyces sp. Agncl-13 TaxID=3400628 RepID=UPI003A83CF3B
MDRREHQLRRILLGLRPDRRSCPATWPGPYERAAATPDKGIPRAARRPGMYREVTSLLGILYGPDEVRVVRGRVPQPFRVLVNPSYEPVGDGRAAFFEGCLSVPGWQAVVARHASVRLTGQDEHGRAVDEVFTGWPARIVQHETDHLDGLLYLDRAELRSLSSNEAMAERWAQPTPEAASAALGFELP